MVGALTGGYFVKCGKWNMIMVCNVAACAGYAFCLVASIQAVLIGRFFLGLSIGGYCVFCPKFVNELTPVEYRGPVGALSQVSVVFAVMLPSVLGLFYDYDAVTTNYTFIRMIWGLPVIFVLAQMLLMVTVFRYDSPTELKQ